MILDSGYVMPQVTSFKTGANKIFLISSLIAQSNSNRLGILNEIVPQWTSNRGLDDNEVRKISVWFATIFFNSGRFLLQKPELFAPCSLVLIALKTFFAQQNQWGGVVICSQSGQLNHEQSKKSEVVETDLVACRSWTSRQHDWARS